MRHRLKVPELDTALSRRGCYAAPPSGLRRRAPAGPGERPEAIKCAHGRYAMALAGNLQPIPHPPGHPFVGNMFDVDPHHPIESLMALAREYGPIFRVDAPGRGSQYVV